MILTIDRIKSLDLFLNRIIEALSSVVGWLHDKQDTLTINLSYKVVEAASAAVQKGKDAILDLEDARVDAGSAYIEAANALKDKYRALEQALADAHAAKVDAINGKLADASLRLLDLEESYDEVVADVGNELGVDIHV